MLRRTGAALLVVGAVCALSSVAGPSQASPREADAPSATSQPAAVGVHQGPFTAVSAGWSHTCALRPSGAVDCWGDNTYGQAVDQPGPYQRVSAGGDYSCGLKASGRVHCWGDIPGRPGARMYTAIDAGFAHMCGILQASGDMRCWGDDTFGQAADRAGPFTRVSAGSFHSCGIRASGFLDCWGGEDDEERVQDVGPFEQVAAGGGFTCGLRAGGSRRCWGNFVPFDDIEAPLKQLTAGLSHLCGLTMSGAADCDSWYNTFGESNDRPGPFTRLSAGAYHTCGLKPSGNIVCWGAADGV